MLKSLHQKKSIQLILGLLIGIPFGFLLQKGGVTDYNIILGQLLLTDFTVVKIMLSAVITGMIGIHLLRSLRLAQLHPKPGSFGSSIVGGLIFGVGFAVLGYCPGTAVGAAGGGYLDALIGGVIGITVGAGIFAAIYPGMQKAILNKGNFGELTLPQLLRVNPWIIVIPVAVLLVLLLLWLEKSGL